MTINQAVEFFEEHKAKNATINRIIEKLIPLQQVGLGYLMMGQSSSTLSGGEAQRLKLASFLGKGGDSTPTLFFLDEPTTGLHIHDIERLNRAFDLLIERGHSIVIIEHNLDVIKTADWIIELGPEGGDRGGYITYEGEPK
jgi:excinuclease ABC subunit A